mmetsp:Transcript_6349/g.9935  ORF Transcript_6349/g.9935 Transcript_6349/m.9935 type:complete len:168 (+) Transcript_6349:294-797(+)
MSHPKLDQAVQKVDEFLAAYPTLCQYDRLRDLEKKTGQPKAYLFFAIFSLLLTLVVSIGGAKLLSDIVAFGYPAYMSFKAIDSSDATDDTQWLTYWVVFASFSITESVMTFVVNWIPFYYIIKSVFFTWLYHPRFMGAGLVYKQIIKPFVMPHLQSFEHSKPQKKEE